MKNQSIDPNTDPSQILNINVGILGHVDSGKTSLAKRLSSISSTASFDKNPQSQERGITLDLGFSAFYIEIPIEIKERYKNNNRLQESKYFQITLVDCPGHASLIKTVVAGATIIDVVLLVVDCIKGIQVQTTECLVLAEILTDNLIVSLNKIDMLTSQVEVDLKIEKLKSIFSKTKFGSNLKICPTSTLSLMLSKEETEEVGKEVKENQSFIDKTLYDNLLNNLIDSIISSIDFSKKKIINENLSFNQFLFSIDHCFAIKNKGTVVTGTVLKGKVESNQEIYFPHLMEKKVIKEIQMFKKQLKVAYEGDRIGMLIKNLHAEDLERSLACSDKSQVKPCISGIFLIKKVKYYKLDVNNKVKYMINSGNCSIMGKCIFFNIDNTTKSIMKYNTNQSQIQYETDKDDILIDDLKSFSLNKKQFYSSEFNFFENLIDTSFAYIKLDHKLITYSDSIIIGINIDCDISNKLNRIAFVGKLIDYYNDESSLLKIVKIKKKEGFILRMQSENTAIVKNLFKKDSNLNDFIGKKVKFQLNDKVNQHDLTKEDLDFIGSIEGSIQSEFGQSGKVKVEVNKNLKSLVMKMKSQEGDEKEGRFFTFKDLKVVLEYNKYIKI